jgi:LysR family transcriptional regulator, transcriptional activator for bauABCD operon
VRRLSDIDIRLLRIFTTIVDCNGFQNAQTALNMAPSTLSAHLSNLEGRLGSRLCERGRRGFRLTHAGEETYSAAQDLFRSLEGFGAAMARVHGQQKARLRLGVIDTVESFDELGLKDAIAAFAAAHPDAFLDLEIMSPEQLQRSLSDGRRDLVIGPAFRAGAGVVYRDLLTEDHRLYCGREHPWFDLPDARIGLPDFQKASFSVRAYQYFDDTYKLGGVRARASVSNMEAQEVLILSGAFVGFLPTHRGERAVAKGSMRAVKPREWTLQSRFAVAYEASTGPSVLKRSFAEALARAIRAPRSAGS